MSERAAVVLEAKSLVKTFEDVGRKVEVLRGVDLGVAKGDRVAIIGSSGPARPRCCSCSAASTSRPRAR